MQLFLFRCCRKHGVEGHKPPLVVLPHTSRVFSEKSPYFETKTCPTATFTGAVLVAPPSWGRRALSRNALSLNNSFAPPPLSTASVLFSFFQTTRRGKKKNPAEKKKKQRTYAFQSVVCGSNPTKQLGTATSPKQPSPHSCARPPRIPFDVAMVLEVPNPPLLPWGWGRQSSSPSLSC